MWILEWAVVSVTQAISLERMLLVERSAADVRGGIRHADVALGHADAENHASEGELRACVQIG